MSRRYKKESFQITSHRVWFVANGFWVGFPSVISVLPCHVWGSESPHLSSRPKKQLSIDHIIRQRVICEERDGTRAETRFRLSPKRTSPFKSVGASVQSTAGSRGVRISFSNAGYTTFGGGVRVLATHSIRQFPLHFPSRASPCAIRFRTNSTTWD